MLKRSALPALFVAGSIAGAALLTADDAISGGQAKRSGGKTAEAIVTAVAGPSWLNHLNIKYGDTSLGRGAGRYGPAPTEPPATPPRATSFVSGQPNMMTGGDLYRLNCQACHRAEGTGSPPEIKSLLSLVQGSSFELVRRQLQGDDKGAKAAAIRKQVAQARTELYRRIREGGQRMPPLAHLQEADIDALYAYLTELAQAPDSQRQAQRTVSWARLGEHVVKGTCHICHDAVGSRPDAGGDAAGRDPAILHTCRGQSSGDLHLEGPQRRLRRDGTAVFSLPWTDAGLLLFAEQRAGRRVRFSGRLPATGRGNQAALGRIEAVATLGTTI